MCFTPLWILTRGGWHMNTFMLGGPLSSLCWTFHPFFPWTHHLSSRLVAHLTEWHFPTTQKEWGWLICAAILHSLQQKEGMGEEHHLQMPAMQLPYVCGTMLVKKGNPQMYLSWYVVILVYWHICWWSPKHVTTHMVGCITLCAVVTQMIMRIHVSTYIHIQFLAYICLWNTFL